MRGVALLIALTLAGCAAPASDPTDPPAEGDADTRTVVGVVLADITSSACAYNDVIFVLPRADVQAFLPEGFTARALFSDAPAAGALVMNMIHCEKGFGWSGADYFALVERIAPPPELDSFDAANRTPREEDAENVLALDIYMLGAYTEHEGLRSIFERGGMPVEPAIVSKTVLPAPVGSAARGAVTDGAGDILTYTVAGRDLGMLTAHHRQWRESPEGLILVERYMSLDGEPLALTQGSASCVVRPGSAIAELVGGVPCSLGQDITNGFAWDGHAYLFPGTSGASFQNANG